MYRPGEALDLINVYSVKGYNVAEWLPSGTNRAEFMKLWSVLVPTIQGILYRYLFCETLADNNTIHGCGNAFGNTIRQKGRLICNILFYVHAFQERNVYMFVLYGPSTAEVIWGWTVFFGYFVISKYFIAYAYASSDNVMFKRIAQFRAGRKQIHLYTGRSNAPLFSSSRVLLMWSIGKQYQEYPLFMFYA